MNGSLQSHEFWLRIWIELSIEEHMASEFSVYTYQEKVQLVKNLTSLIKSLSMNDWILVFIWNRNVVVDHLFIS